MDEGKGGGTAAEHETAEWETMIWIEADGRCGDGGHGGGKGGMDVAMEADAAGASRRR